MNDSNLTAHIVQLQTKLAALNKQFERAVQCSDIEGAHQETAYEFGRMEATATSIASDVRSLIGTCDLRVVPDR